MYVVDELISPKRIWNCTTLYVVACYGNKWMVHVREGRKIPAIFEFFVILTNPFHFSEFDHSHLF